MNTAPMIIGTLTTTEPRNVTEHYECAAWEKIVTVPAGTYNVVAYASYRDGLPFIGHTLYVNMTGEITGGTMRARIGSHVSKRDEMVERYGQISDVSDRLSTSFPVREGVKPHTVAVLLKSWEGERTIDRDVVALSDLVLPDGLVLDDEKVEVAFVYESQGVTYASIKPRRDAYAVASKEAAAARKARGY